MLPLLPTCLSVHPTSSQQKTHSLTRFVLQPRSSQKIHHRQRNPRRDLIPQIGIRKQARLVQIDGGVHKHRVQVCSSLHKHSLFTPTRGPGVAIIEYQPCEIRTAVIIIVSKKKKKKRNKGL